MNYTSIVPSEQVSLENSNFKQAVEDLLTCLAKRLKALPADSRYLNWNFKLTIEMVFTECVGPLLRRITSLVLLKLTARTLLVLRRA